MPDPSTLGTAASVATAAISVAGWLYTRIKLKVEREDKLQKLWEITAELRPNGGSTIKDRVTNLEVMQKDQMVKLHDITKDLADHREALQRIEKKL